MLNLANIKVGTIIEFRGSPHEAIFVEHSKQGRGGAILRTKLRNLENGATVENTFKGADKVEEANLSYKKAQFLYKDSDKLFFMDNKTFDQIELPKSAIGSQAEFLREETAVDLVIINGKVATARIPIKIDLKVTYTEPGYKGNTQSAAFKPATLETGAQIQVPLFISNGELVRVDTRTGTYVERVK
ncbi:MAG: elongation factor P [bacterium]|nr:elongation factor P [bacterium]